MRREATCAPRKVCVRQREVLGGKMSCGGFIVTVQPSRVEVLAQQLCVAPTSHGKIERGRGGFAERMSLNEETFRSCYKNQIREEDEQINILLSRYTH